ncbi:DUF2125 domain-containing protein [Pacificoceanicola onchidii]|uniref:DUF2125 domain-containing protein n=1 Tax=Pacificoceanicola onchidii TaxID=2562685 RepID=UPI001455F4C6|nr:DUF2125 domain-containing protein [Pacificoceanicola onchidii]
MKRLVFLSVALAALWAGYWFLQAHSLRGSLEAWFEERRGDGWEASYSDMSVRGFPNRLDVQFDDLILADPERGTVWEAPFFQMFSLVYSPGHWIFAWPETQSVTTRDGTYRINSEGLRASLVMEGDTFLRSNVEAVTLNVSGAASVAIAGLDLGVAVDEVKPRIVRLGLNAAGIAGKAGAMGPTGTVDAVSLRAEAAFDDIWTRDALKGARPQPTALSIPLADYRAGDVQLKATGDWDIDGKGRLDGSGTLRAENWRDLLDRAEDNGDLPGEVTAILREMFGLIAGLSGNKKTLDLTFSFDKGRIALGIIPLGKAPRLRFD